MDETVFAVIKRQSKGKVYFFGFLDKEMPGRLRRLLRKLSIPRETIRVGNIRRSAGE